ncbi:MULTISPECIES: hypothetical protein [Pseudomonadota]|jgi:gold/copper resistance efflux system membrane fusion protein|uniref:hypothetical protein n=1 Tax=Pseudomonadota TaxID=1224 RepID=UPI001F1E109E|nr:MULTISPECIES: hypothetical protein [Pseudomonadota]MCX2516354.1 hypothetical protein [Pseudomonas aeruginosa]MDI2437421.1 hypothetical protein [Pseudomonas aeruginosa]WEM00763.1 hypothetical protein PW274_10895 [Delftia tsuruhatensis]|tara:strand:+ start:4252 stop:4482 length:231 start_codon:yes stop_codon:yes gene_type:complete
MRKKIRIIVVAGVIAAVGGIAIAARDAKDEGKAAAPPAGAPMAPQVPVAEVITRTVAGIRAMRNGGVPHRCARRTG